MLWLRWGHERRDTEPNSCADSNASADGCADSNADSRAYFNANICALRITYFSANIYSDSRARSGAIASADGGTVSFADRDSWRPDRHTDDADAHSYANSGADTWAIGAANLSVTTPHSVG